MSMNYYLETKDANLAFDLGKRVSINHIKRRFDCHLCQTFLSYKPLFEIHSYCSFKELKEILSERGYQFEIVDESGFEYSLDEFINMMEKANKTGKSRNVQLEELSRKFHVDSEGYEFLDDDFQ